MYEKKTILVCLIIDKKVLRLYQITEIIFLENFKNMVFNFKNFIIFINFFIYFALQYYY